LLLYPQVGQAETKDYFIFGHKFYVRTVDLNQEFEAIEQELFGIVNPFFTLRQASANTA
jgi:hypothetical protein